MTRFVNIHTHRPTGLGIELRTAGIHPWEAARELDSVRACGLAARLGDSLDAAQAIGETGLDRVCGVDCDAQREMLRAHLQLACDRGLPVVLHCVRAFEPLMEELRRCTPRAVIFHGFIGSPEQAKRAVERGYWLSFGMRSMDSPRSVEAMRRIPIGRLFLETDDEPVAIGVVYDRAAKLLGRECRELSAAVAENYRMVFASK